VNLYYPWHLLLLFLLLPLVFFLTLQQRRRLKRFTRFAEGQFKDLYLRRMSPFYLTLKTVLLLLALVLVIFALVRPQWDYEIRNFESQGLDILICLDVSKSMDAQDLTPSRLQRAKLQMDALLDRLRGDRVGIIAFAGKATLECPLTDDYESAALVLNSLTTDSVVRLGTDIGAAMALAERSFLASGGSKVLVLITDGEDLGGNALAQAKRLKANGVRIYAIGVGTEQGSQITDPGSGRTAFSKLDATALQEIATLGEGKYMNLASGQGDLDAILHNLYSVEKGRDRNQNLTALKEQYALPAALALLLLLLEALVIPLRREWK